jgi:hypothetical protein
MVSRFSNGIADRNKLFAACATLPLFRGWPSAKPCIGGKLAMFHDHSAMSATFKKSPQPAGQVGPTLMG